MAPYFEGARAVLLAVLLTSFAVGSLAFGNQRQEPKKKEGQVEQSPTQKTTTSNPGGGDDGNKETKENRATADKLLSQRAIEQLVLAVPDLKQIDNSAVSLPLANIIVKKLSPYRPDVCRDLLNYLFDQTEKKVAQESSKTKNSGAKIVLQAQLRKIISMASRFDTELAEKFIARATDKQNMFGKSDGYFSAANELVESNPDKAVQMANKVVEAEFTTRALEFIGHLRNKDPKLAKAYLLSLFQVLETRKYPSVNELLLLYPYVFLSRDLPHFRPDGRVAWTQNVDYGNGLENQTIDPELAQIYLRFSTKLMLEVDRYQESYGPNKADGRADLFFIDSILLPSAQPWAPALVEVLQQRRVALLALLAPAQQQLVKSTVEGFNTVRANIPASADNLLERADASDDLDKKCRLYFEAARTAVEQKHYNKAIDAIDKIPARKIREAAKDLILFDIASSEIKDGKIAEARRWAAGHNDPLGKAYLLSSVALALAGGKNKDVFQANEDLNEVTRIASSLPPGTEKFAVLSGAANVYSRYDRTRALELLQNCIDTVNRADQFDESITVQRLLTLDGFSYGYRLYQNDLTFNDLLARLSRDSFNVLIAEISGIDRPAIKVKAIIAVCEAII